MTDARISETILINDRVDALSDGAYRMFINSLAWSVSQGTDGQLPERALRRLHPDGLRLDLVAELVDAEFWIDKVDGYEIRNFLRYQSTNESVERKRELTRLRNKSYREREDAKQKKKLLGVDDPPPDSETHDETRHTTRGPIGTRNTAQEQGQGLFKGNNELTEPQAGLHDPWTLSSEPSGESDALRKVRETWEASRRGAA